MKTIILLLAITASIAAHANEFRYKLATGKCQNQQGVIGMNPLDTNRLFVLSNNSQKQQFNPANAECVDFSNFDFESFIGHQYAYLSNWNFRGANLSNANLGLMVIENSDFSGTQFSNATFAYTAIRDCHIDKYTKLHASCRPTDSPRNVWCIQ